MKAKTKAETYVKERITKLSNGDTFEQWINDADFEIQLEVSKIIEFLAPVPNNGIVYIMEETNPLNPQMKTILLRRPVEEVLKRVEEYK